MRGIAAQEPGWHAPTVVHRISSGGAWPNPGKMPKSAENCSEAGFARALHAAGVPKSFWKRHKLKVLDVLLQNYVQLFFSTPRIFWGALEKNLKFFDFSKSEKISMGNRHFFNEKK